MIRLVAVLALIAFFPTPGVRADDRSAEVPSLQAIARDAQPPVDPEQVIIQCSIVELRGNVSNALKEAGFREAAGTNRFISLPDQHDAADADGLKGMLKKLSTLVEVEVLSQPQVRCLMGQNAEVHMGGALAPIPYLVRTGKTTFESRELKPESRLGLSVRFSVRAGDEANQITLSPLRVSTTTLDGREPIAGLELDVGKPIISTRTLETSVTFYEGSKVNGITLPGPAGRQPVLFLAGRRVKSNVDAADAELEKGFDVLRPNETRSKSLDVFHLPRPK